MKLPEIPRPLIGIPTRLPEGGDGARSPYVWLHQLLGYTDAPGDRVVTIDRGSRSGGLHAYVSHGNGSCAEVRLHSAKALVLASELQGLHVEQVDAAYPVLDLSTIVSRQAEGVASDIRTGFILVSPDGDDFVLMRAGAFAPELHAFGRLGLIGESAQPHEVLLWKTAEAAATVASLRAAYQRLPDYIAEPVINTLKPVEMAAPTCLLSAPHGGAQDTYVHPRVARAPHPEAWEVWLRFIRRANEQPAPADGSRFVEMSRGELLAALSDEQDTGKQRAEHIDRTSPDTLLAETAEERADLRVEMGLSPAALRAHRTALDTAGCLPTRGRGPFPFFAGQAAGIRKILFALG